MPRIELNGEREPVWLTPQLRDPQPEGERERLNSPTPKTPCYTQRYPGYLLYKSSYSRFCPKFRCHGNRGNPWVNLNDHGLCCSNKLLYKRRALSMGKSKFRPSTAPTFIDRSSWNSNLRNTSGRPPHMPNLVKIGLRGWAGRTPSLPQFWFYPFFLFVYSSHRVLVIPLDRLRRTMAHRTCFPPR